MARKMTFLVRLTDEEYAIFQRMAEAEKLPVGTFVRRLLLLEAERRGIIPAPVVITQE